MDTEKLTKVLVTGIDRQDIAHFVWVNDERLVFQMDNEGDEGYGLFAVDRDGGRATFLPQVWEQLPQPADFLFQLKRKAGLPGDFWHDGLRLQRYSVAKFQENA